MKNLLLFTIDSFMSGTLDSIDPIRYPNLSRLIKEGFLFDSCVTASDETASSHASIMTGLYTVSHAVRYNDINMKPSLRTIAEVLKNRGYDTAAAVGVYQLSSKKGFSKGFDTYYNYSTIDPVVQVAAKVKVGRFYGAGILFLVIKLIKNILGKKKEKSSRSTEKILQYFKDNSEKSFFCWLHYFDLHTETIDQYWDALKNVDYNIGRILKKLMDIGKLDETIIVITADHGICFNNEGRAWYSEGNIYDAMIKVPLLFYNKNNISHGRSSAMVRSIDIFPTVLALLGIDGKDYPVDGKRIDRIMIGGNDGAEEAFVESRPLHIWAHGLRTPNWKYMIDSTGEEKLYFLDVDKMEVKDVKKDNPGVLSELRNKTKGHFGNSLVSITMKEKI